MKKDFFNKILVFLIIYLVISSVFNIFISDKNTQQATGDITIEVDKEISQNSLVEAKIFNNTSSNITIPSECPQEPLQVSRYSQGEWQNINLQPEISCEEIPENYEIAANSSLTIPYTYWSNKLFDQQARYKISLNTEVNGEAKTFESNEFEIVKPGIFRLLWLEILYRPIFNALIFIISILPGFSLGAGIILLTLLIRTILLIPSQKAMRAQKRMQEIQPKLEEIREKYKGNQEKIASETMKIWKTQKVNPFGSCLPLLIQFPILIALFYAIKSGLNPDQTTLLYSGLKEFSFTQIQTNFLGILELTKINAYVLPVIIGLLQFAQMKMGLLRQNKKHNKDEKKQKKKKSEMEMANNMMIYFLPVMIAMFTASLPAGVGLYWGISTTYGIVQQFIVNHEKPQSNSDKEPKVTVIN